MTKRGGVPPVEHQFRKGESGNPNGRPKKPSQQAPAPALFTLLRPVAIARAGEPVRYVSGEDAIAEQTVERALKGDKRAWDEVADMIIARDKARAGTQPVPKPSIRLNDSHDVHNAEPAMLILEIANLGRESPRQLKLEHWGVAAALSRRAIATLSKMDKVEITNSMVDRKAPNWPRRFLDEG